MNAVVGLCVAGMLLVAGCSSPTGGGGTSSGSPSNSPSTSASSAGAAPGSSSSSSAVSSGSGSAEAGSPSSPSTRSSSGASTIAGGCGAGQLSISGIPSPSGGISGHNAVVLEFRNISDTTCTLYGYPGAAALNSAGRQEVQLTRVLSGMMGGGSESTVTLHPGTTVYAVAEGSTVPSGSGSCPNYPALLVTPPNTADSTTVSIAPPGCDMEIHPVSYSEGPNSGPGSGAAAAAATPPASCASGTCTKIATCPLGPAFAITVRNGADGTGHGSTVIELMSYDNPYAWYVVHDTTPFSLTCSASGPKPNLVVSSYSGPQSAEAFGYVFSGNHLIALAPVTSNTTHIVAHDLNGDGWLDIAELQDNSNPDYVDGSYFWRTYVSDGSTYQSTGCTTASKPAPSTPTKPATASCA